MKKIAVVLSGCGNKDGAEVTETVSTFLAISQAGAQYDVFAPDREYEAIDFTTNQPMREKRNLLVESARLSRGQIQNITQLISSNYDALVFPGGYGAALHLSTWAKEGSKCKVLPEVEKVILDFYKAQKPIGAICIAPTLIAKVLGTKGVTVTIGFDKETIQEIQKTGAQHVTCPVEDYVTDREHKILTTAAYMEASTPYPVFLGISKMMKELLEMA